MIARTPRLFTRTFIALVSCVFLSSLAPPTVRAGQILDKCNVGLRYADADQETVSRIHCYIKGMEDIKYLRDYIGRLETSGVAVRGSRTGEERIFRGCGIVVKETYTVEKQVEGGTCSKPLNDYLAARTDYYEKYCLIGRWVFAPEMRTLWKKGTSLETAYESCFNMAIGSALTVGDHDLMATIGMINGRDSFISVLRKARQRYTTQRMEEDHRALANACNALVTQLSTKRPGFLTKNGITGC